MATDYKKQWEEFKKLSFDERKGIVIGILESFRGQGETFDLIYDYITRWVNITDQDLQDVYDGLIKTAFQVDKEKEVLVIANLESVRSRAVGMREQEEKEKRLAQEEVNSMLAVMV